MRRVITIVQTRLKEPATGLLFTLFSSFIFCTTGYSQTNYQARVAIDRFIEQTDSLSNRSQVTFHLDKFLDRDRIVKETWHYTLDRGKVVIFQVRYQIDSMEYTEVYYVNKGRLVCAEEYHSLNIAGNEDELKWGEIAYFDNFNMMQYVSMGRKLAAYRSPDPAREAQDRFRGRYAQLQMNLRW